MMVKYMKLFFCVLKVQPPVNIPNKSAKRFNWHLIKPDKPKQKPKGHFTGSLGRQSIPAPFSWTENYTAKPVQQTHDV